MPESHIDKWKAELRDELLRRMIGWIIPAPDEEQDDDDECIRHFESFFSLSGIPNNDCYCFDKRQEFHRLLSQQCPNDHRPITQQHVVIELVEPGTIGKRHSYRFFCTYSAKNISQIVNLCVPLKFGVSFGFYLRTI